MTSNLPKPSSLKTISLLLTGYLLFIFGKSIQNVITTVVLESLDTPPIWVGAVASAFYVGFIFGSIYGETLIIKLGQKRSYFWLGSLTATSALLQCTCISAFLWGILILLSGFTCAGLVILIESQLLQTGPTTYRGRLLSLYMIITYFSQASSQQILKTSLAQPATLFLVSALFMLSALIPFLYNRTACNAPDSHSGITLSSLWNAAPIGATTCFIGGIFQGTIGLVLAAFLHNLHFTYAAIADTMCFIIMGSTLLQYPIGSLADKYNPRYLLACIASATLLVSGIFNQYAVMQQSAGYLWYGFLLGGLTYSLYPIGINIATANEPNHKQLGLVQSLLLSYSIGAAIGPITLSSIRYFYPEYALFCCFGLISLALLTIIFLCKTRPTHSLSDWETQRIIPE
jgi:MFS family permease